MYSPQDDSPKKQARFVVRAYELWNYLSSGVWYDARRKWWINGLRTANLSVKSFLNRDIQTQACAMTYRTVLAIVPALALLLAIGRGFGMQNVLQAELMRLFPAQQMVTNYIVDFVDSYLSQTSEGLFLGIGIAFLLYTMIALLSNVEDTFNLIWGQDRGRSLWRKISDYTAMMLILPVLMLCASGLSLLVSSTLRVVFHFSFMTPVISLLLEAAQWMMTILFFTALYILIPNTKVKFFNAFVSGIIAGVCFLLLQWLFVNGTIYVTRYNAIYGSFAILPLLLIWLQLVWTITLAGAVVCYSSQNVFAFSFDHEVETISAAYEAKVTIAIAAVVARRFVDCKPSMTARDLMNNYDFPARLVTRITDRLCAAGIFSRVMMPQEKDVFGFQLAVDPQQLSVEALLVRVYTLGSNNFVPDFNERFAGVDSLMKEISAEFSKFAGSTLVSEIDISAHTIQQ